MNFAEILRELEEEVYLPIVPERIAKLVKKEGVVEDIIYIGVDINTDILRGSFVRLTYEDSVPGFMPPPYALPDSGLAIKIYYDRTQPQDYVDLVINKELLHALDPDMLRTASRERVIQLANHIRLPTEAIISTASSDNAGAVADYISDFRAVVAMVPEAIRAYVCQRHSEGKISEEEIAELFGIPLRYVRVVLSDIWPDVRKVWVKISD